MSLDTCARTSFRPSAIARARLLFGADRSVPALDRPWHGIDHEYFAVNASGGGGGSACVALVACKKSEERTG